MSSGRSVAALLDAVWRTHPRVAGDPLVSGPRRDGDEVRR
jgi:hypothetical protein